MKNLTKRLRYSIYLLLYTFISVGAYGQCEYDTIKVVLLVSDTAEQYYINQTFTHGEIIDGQYVDYFKTDTIYTGKYNAATYWIHALKIREYIYSYGTCYYPGKKKYNHYTNRVEYLMADSTKMKDNLIIWQSVRRE